MFFSRCPYRAHEAKMARIFLAPIGVPDIEGVKDQGWLIIKLILISVKVK